MAKLISIVYKPARRSETEGAYLRVAVDSALLAAGHGIQGDGKASRNRSLNIMAADTLHELAGEGFQTQPGQMGEQLIVSGMEIDALAAGTCLRLGETACVEVVEPRTGCGKFERNQGKRREEAARRLGVIATVKVGGAIRVGDPVEIVPAPVELAVPALGL